MFGTAKLWPLAVLFPAIPALILALVLPFCPERFPSLSSFIFDHVYSSPRYLLISVGDRAGAKKAVRFFAGPEDADRAFEDLVREAALAPSVPPLPFLPLSVSRWPLSSPGPPCGPSSPSASSASPSSSPSSS